VCWVYIILEVVLEEELDSLTVIAWNLWVDMLVAEFLYKGREVGVW
jgi:hypothetical protein